MSVNLDIENIVRRVMENISIAGVRSNSIMLNVSNRHIHLTREVLDALFGVGFELQVFKPLMQPGEFASTSTITIAGPSMSPIEKVRILGPVRKYTQVELANSDRFKLGIDYLPVRKSGDVAGSVPINLIGPKGVVALKEGAIRATRHIHMTPQDALNFNVADGDFVKVRIGKERSLILEKVLIRVSEKYALEMHIDTDDAAAAGINSGIFVDIIH